MASIGGHPSPEPPAGRGRHRAPDADGSPAPPVAEPTIGLPPIPADDPAGPDPAGSQVTGALPVTPPEYGAGAPAGPASDTTAAQPAVRVEAPPAEAGSRPSSPARRPRAGRNLPAAIGVGLGLGALALASLFIWRPAFLFVLMAAVAVATWEMTRALGRAGDASRAARPPLVPLLVGAVVTEGLGWFGGLEALTVGLLFTVVAVVIWRLADGAIDYRRDVLAATLVATYVSFLAGFGVLLARPEDGAWRVVAALAMVVCSDTGGYAVGVFLGRHRMAPAVSPGKSWEGFAGSVATCAVAGAVLLHLVFDTPWWYGAVFGIAVSLVSVLGDLAESLLKRDLGIKDMGHLLPGHGGAMDRLDSILFALPVSYALLIVLAPPA